MLKQISFISISELNNSIYQYLEFGIVIFVNIHWFDKMNNLINVYMKYKNQIMLLSYLKSGQNQNVMLMDMSEFNPNVEIYLTVNSDLRSIYRKSLNYASNGCHLDMDLCHLDMA